MKNYYTNDLWELLIFLRKEILKNNCIFKTDNLQISSIGGSYRFTMIYAKNFTYRINDSAFIRSPNLNDDDKKIIYDYLSQNFNDFNCLNNNNPAIEILDKYIKLDIYS